MKRICAYASVALLLLTIACGRNEDNEKFVIKSSDSVSNAVSTEEESKLIYKDSGTPVKVISTSEVKSHVGDSVCVKGLVADVYAGEKVSYLNFDRKFPKNTFTAAIFPKSYPSFGDLSKYKGREVAVTGKIKTYNGKPQIILNSQSDIKILK